MFIAGLSVYRKITKRRSENLAKVTIPLLPTTGLIFDFGCGNGYLAESILKTSLNITIIGVDVIKDENLDESILENPRFKFQIITPDAVLPFPDNNFNVVIACASMHHTNSPEFYLKELNRITKTDGHIILIEEMYLNLFDKLCISAHDFILNKIKKGVPIPLEFRSLNHYIDEFTKNNLEIIFKGSIRPVFPYVHHYVYKLKKRN